MCCLLYEMMKHDFRINYFLNITFNIVFPIFLSIPAFDIGTPVALDIFCFVCVMPKARFHEKLSPGIGDDFFVMFYLAFGYTHLDFHLFLQVPLLAISQ